MESQNQTLLFCLCFYDLVQKDFPKLPVYTVNSVNPSSVDFTEADFIESTRQEKEEIIPWILEKLAKAAQKNISLT